MKTMVAQIGQHKHYYGFKTSQNIISIRQEMHKRCVARNENLQEANDEVAGTAISQPLMYRYHCSLSGAKFGKN